MRYQVTVEVQSVITQVVSVEAATRDEATATAIKVIKHYNDNITKLDVLLVMEDKQPDRNEHRPTLGKGYIARIL